jgi:Icc protein
MTNITKEKSLEIVQISDIHLFANQNNELLGVNTQKSFEAVIQLLKNDPKPIDFILLTGDLTQDQSHEAYKRVAELLKPFNTPMYYIPGNHDDIRIMEQIYPIAHVKNDKQLIFDHWQFVLLNSQKKNVVHGYLAKKELTFLEKCLTEYPSKHTAAVLHHHPFPIGTTWLDPQGLHEPEQFWKILSKHRQVNLVIFGHIHQDSHTNHQGIDCYSPPSTCIQFKPKQVEFKLDHIPPGYRRFTLHADGKIETAVYRTQEYIGTFDIQATGY